MNPIALEVHRELFSRFEARSEPDARRQSEHDMRGDGMAQNDPYAAFRFAVEKEAELRREAGRPRTRAAGVAFPQTGDVELSDPSRLGPTWRTIFAFVLLVLSTSIVLPRFYEVDVAADTQPSNGVFYVVLIALLVCFLLMVVSWGSVKVKWSPTSDVADDAGNDDEPAHGVV
jgi:hypothetical protein